MKQAADLWSQFFDVGKDALVSTIDPTTGVILVQSGTATDATADTDSSEMWGPAGYYGLPASPTAGQPSCQLYVQKRSDIDGVLGTRDVRDAYVYGNLKPGERAVVGGYPTQGQLLIRNDGSVTLLTTDSNTAQGNLVYHRVTPTEDRFFAPWGSYWSDASGFHVRTWHGAKLDMTGLGLPAPFNTVNSVITLTADLIELDGAVKLGRDAGTTQQVVQALPLQVALAPVITALTDIQNTLAGIATMIGTFTGVGAFPGLVPFGLLVSECGVAIALANTSLSAIATSTQTNAGVQ